MDTSWADQSLMLAGSISIKLFFFIFNVIILQYVQQDELFMGTLTVKEHLLIQARLRLVDATERKIRKRVNEVFT